MIRRKTRTFRKKLRLLTDSQHRTSVRHSLYARTHQSWVKTLFFNVIRWR